jgi:hypothetical protein
MPAAVGLKVLEIVERDGLVQRFSDSAYKMGYLSYKNALIV